MVSLSLWTFKGTIWHPELAIDERQLTPLWHLRAAGGQAHVGGRRRAVTCPSAPGAGWAFRAQGCPPSFTFSSGTARDAGMAAEFPDKL